MNLYNIKNIKDLPQLEQILPGNFLIVENPTGTNKLDFDDFVIGPRNTSFANQVFNDVTTLSTYAISLSSYDGQIVSMVRSASALNQTFIRVLSTRIEVLSAAIDKANSDINLFFGLSARLKQLVPGL